MQVLSATCGAWHLRHTARAFHHREALVGLWISERSTTGLPAGKYRRCWPFQLARKPFYSFASQFQVERAFYALFPIWRVWLKRRQFPSAMSCMRSTVMPPRCSISPTKSEPGKSLTARTAIRSPTAVSEGTSLGKAIYWA